MRYYIQTYGCQMNVHESEKIASGLRSLQMEEARVIDEADVIVYNTCCIRDTAEKKILGNIGDAKHLKHKNKNIIIAVVGCMSQQDGLSELLKKRFPFIDIILGTANINELASKIAAILGSDKRQKYFATVDPTCEISEDGLKPYRTSGANAWVNIMYGCNNFCSYCIVPYVRGRERSREKDVIIAEVKELLDNGYKEITLLGQNVNSYDAGFSSLLESLAGLDYKYRLRFMTSHPKDFNIDIAKAIARYPNLAKSLHLPVQSGNNRILSLMNRKYTKEEYLDKIDMVKSINPDIAITSDIIVGFPSETEDEFLDTLELVERVKFSSAFTFVYSPRRGTLASTMEQISPSVKKERIKKLVALQNLITERLSVDYVGKVYEILVDDFVKGKLVGRTESGRLVSFEGDITLIGQFIRVKIVKHKASALIGEVVS